MCGTRRAVLSFANRNVVDANGSALYNSPRLGVDAIHPTGLPGRLAMTLRVTSALALARDRGYDGQRMGADTVQPSRRLAHPTTRLPRVASRAATRATTDRSAPVLTAPLCPSTRPLYQAPLPAVHRESLPAHAVAFSTGVAAGYDRNGPGSLPPNSPSQNRPPTSPVSHFRCSADHRPASRCDAGPDVRRAVGVCMMGRARGSHLTSGIWQGTLCPKKEVKMILKEP